MPAYYSLHLPAVLDRRAVGMRDKEYVAGAFHFTLDHDRMMKLLMDRSLYPDENLFLRELLQNPLDACRLAEARAKAAHDPLYVPHIVVWDQSGDAENPCVIFQDNGVGMSLHEVEQYFTQVGRSYYRSRALEGERIKLRHLGIELDSCSQFGIGILTCFLVADRFEVLTYRYGSEPLKITIEGPTKYFSIKRLKAPVPAQFQGPPKNDEEAGPLGNRPGTRITVPVRTTAKVDVWETLRRFAVNVDYEVHVYDDAATNPRIIPKLDWEKRGIEITAKTLALIDKDEDPDEDPDESVDEAYARRMAPVVEALRPVLAVSRIPFERWEFSKHVRGIGWFWLLAGEDGSPCPERGYLTAGWMGVQVTGAPAVLEDAQERARKAGGGLPDRLWIEEICLRAIPSSQMLKGKLSSERSTNG